MNVPQTMVGVPTHATTWRDPSHAAAELAMNLVVTEGVAMVSTFYSDEDSFTRIPHIRSLEMHELSLIHI